MLYIFNIDLSDIDRGVYQNLEFRLAQHPSETPTYLLTRVLAYIHSYQENLHFSTSGLSDPDSAALSALGPNGQHQIWIEIGNPSSRKLHKAGKTSQQVIVYTYKNPEVLTADIKNNDVHRANEIEIYSFESNFLNSLEKSLLKNNKWSVIIQQQNIIINLTQGSFSSEIINTKLA